MAIQNSDNLTVTGVVAADGAGAFAGRTITGTADFIDVTNGTGVSGNPTLDVATNFEATGMHGWNGSILETVDIGVTSDGATITFSAEQSGTGDLTVTFSDGYYDWDTTPADTVTLTAGSDTSPQINYVYFLQSTKTLTAATGGWPSAEHAPLATVFCQSAASLQTDGAYKVHAWTDHVTRTDNQGHVADLNFWIRQQNSTWIDGVTQTYTITTNGGAADNVILTTVSGNVLQLHSHTFPAFSGTPDVYVVNDNVTPYNKVTDLNALLTDSTGASMSGRFFSLVIWGCVSEDSSDCKLFCNLPGGSYNNQTGVEEDLSSFANYTIPSDFTGTGFLISEWKLRHQAAASGTWTSIDEIDLRGLLPAINAGGGAAGATEFPDNVFRVVDESDGTKELAFECSGITTATTRTLTVPDASGTIALASGLTANGMAYALDGNTVDATAAPTNGQLMVGATSAVPNLLTPWMMQGQNCWFWNLSFTHSGGTLTLAGGDGTALSSTNPGYVVLPSNATAGELALHTITANDTLTVSDMDGCTFGTTAAIAWGSALPLYIGFMADSSDANLEPVVTRLPNLEMSPSASGNIGDPSAANADSEESVFAFNDITETNYTSKHVGTIGSLQATKAVTTDAWTLSALGITDGAGLFNENTLFTMPVAQNGAAASKYWKDNGGTAPAFTSSQVNYFIQRNGMCSYHFAFTTCTTVGVGAVTALLSIPYVRVHLFGNTGWGTGVMYDNSAGSYFTASYQYFTELRLFAPAFKAGSAVLNEDIDSSDTLYGNMLFQIKGGT